MTNPSKVTPPHDPLAATLSAADDRILLSHWLPPSEGIVPRIRVGKRWVSVLWALPLGFVALILAIAAAQSLREYPEVRALIEHYPASLRQHPRSIPASRGGCGCSTS